MRTLVIGSRWLGERAFFLARAFGEVAAVVAPAGDRLACAAAGIAPVFDPAVMRAGGVLPGERFDLVVAAHASFRVPAELVARADVAIGFHPSLLPRHPGRGAVRDTIAGADTIAGGTVYHLTEELDGGPLAAQGWCFVRPGDTPETLWRRELAPMGLRMLGQAMGAVAAGVKLRAVPQRPWLDTRTLRFEGSAL